MATIKFSELKQRISDGINSKIKDGKVVQPDPEGFVLVEGFSNIILQAELEGGVFALGGPTIPCVTIIGKKTGIVHTFALKVIIPDLDI